MEVLGLSPHYTSLKLSVVLLHEPTPHGSWDGAFRAPLLRACSDQADEVTGFRHLGSNFQVQALGLPRRHHSNHSTGSSISPEVNMRGPVPRQLAKRSGFHWHRKSAKAAPLSSEHGVKLTFHGKGTDQT